LFSTDSAIYRLEAFDEILSPSCPRLSRTFTSLFVPYVDGWNKPSHDGIFFNRIPNENRHAIKAVMSKPGPISAKPLSALLGDVFSDAYARQGFASRELVTRWAEIAGPEIAAHSEPMKIQWPRPIEGQKQEPATLVLRVEGPVALEIQHSSDVILQRVNRFFGWNAVGRLALRQAPLSRKSVRNASRLPDATDVAQVAETLSSIEDNDLRTALARLGASIKRN
jgi:hypothetical protein